MNLDNHAILSERIFWDPADILPFILIMPQDQRLPLLSYIAAHDMHCSRCCIIMYEESNDSLVIVAGHPEHGHGIGTEISTTLGKDFLESVIEGGKIVLIEDPENDPRVAYMRTLIEQHAIRKQIFIPCFSFGIIVLDYTSKDPEPKKDSLETEAIVEMAASLKHRDYS